MSSWLGLPELKRYRELDLYSLPLNHAFVIANTSVDNIRVYSVSDDCFNCPYTLEKRLQAGEEVSWQVDTSSRSTWRIQKTCDDDVTDRRGLYCVMRPTFGEFGVYRLDVGRCEVRPEVQPVDVYFPLLLCSLLVLSICTVFVLIKFLLKRRSNIFKTSEAVDTPADEKMQSLHLLRGFILTLIIFITSGGGGYPIFKKEWGGLSLADCLFFVYVWTIGVRIPTDLNEAINSGRRKCSVIGDIFTRSLVLIFLGISMQSFHRVFTETSTIWCPLQKMGIAYFIVATMYVLIVRKSEIKSKDIICKTIANIMFWIMSGLLLALFIIMIATLNSLNCNFVTNLENQRTLNVVETTANCNSDFTETINIWFVAVKKELIYVDSYYGFSDGIMGIMSTIIYTLIGLKAGAIYLHHESHSVRLRLWTLWAIIFGIGGVMFAAVSHPLRFNLWPISSILLTSTLSLHSFSLVYILSEIWKFNSSILTSLGVTSLAVLSGHLLFTKTLPFTWVEEFHSHFFFLLQNIWILFLWIVLSVVLMKKNIRFSM